MRTFNGLNVRLDNEEGKQKMEANFETGRQTSPILEQKHAGRKKERKKRAGII